MAPCSSGPRVSTPDGPGVHVSSVKPVAVQPSASMRLVRWSHRLPLVWALALLLADVMLQPSQKAWMRACRFVPVPLSPACYRKCDSRFVTSILEMERRGMPEWKAMKSAEPTHIREHFRSPKERRIL